ncbi:hypothetical protein [Butyrivibrio proteoclasticus]|uniref:hypothetical protein n=1 Tax=Butyrivibrio proteoclasticus TaxID=43305 RepID=UPI00047DAEDC|nr:hypothetical protein [Butyrivibrio proteoclasticus]
MWLKKRNSELTDEVIKLRELQKVLMMWIQDYQDGRRLISFFHKNGYKSIAIYGFADLGIALCGELENTDVEVKYGIDRNAEMVYSEKTVYKPYDDLPPVDVVVVTAVHYFDDVKRDLEKKLSCPIISIEDVIIGA